MKSIDFSRNLIKGKIAETIFEQMIREEGRFTVIPFGYEHTMPTLAQYRGHVEVEQIIDNISDAPDFVLISNDKTKVFLIEVKYQNKLSMELVGEYAEKLLKRWKISWVFVATPLGFYCDTCKNIVENGKIGALPELWVTEKRQREYQKLLNEFE